MSSVDRDRLEQLARRVCQIQRHLGKPHEFVEEQDEIATALREIARART